MKTILVAIDCSSESVNVILEAIDLAGRLNGRLVVLNVTHGRDTEKDQHAFRKVLERLQTLATYRLRAMQYGHAITGDELQLIGDPATVIIEEARRLNVDFIVMGTTRHRSILAMLGRGVASKVLSSAPCPVLMVPLSTSSDLQNRRVRISQELRRVHLLPSGPRSVKLRPRRSGRTRSIGRKNAAYAPVHYAIAGRSRI